MVNDCQNLNVAFFDQEDEVVSSAVRIFKRIDLSILLLVLSYL